MILSIASDLHLTSRNGLGSQFFLNNNSSLLILCGDVCEIGQLEHFKTSFFDRISQLWENILYIPGNHEFYHCPSYTKGISVLDSFLKQYPNIHLLNNSIKEIDGIVFVGSTLWSSLDNFNPVTVFYAPRKISDYSVIFTEPFKKLTPKDTFTFYKESVKYIEKTILTENKPVVVLTHHAPSFKSVHENYKGNLLNGVFVSDLDDLILENPQIKLWVHGHCHSECNYYIGLTQIVCHPKGYWGENYSNPEQYVPQLIEI